MRSAEEYNARLEAGESHPAENPVFILDPNRRGGLEDRHPFTEALYQQPIEVLKTEFHKHKEAERDRRKQVEAKETTDRLKRLAREASKFMREELEEAGALGSGEAREDSVTVCPGSRADIWVEVDMDDEDVVNVVVDDGTMATPVDVVVDGGAATPAEERQRAERIAESRDWPSWDFGPRPS
jgi:hypothetical protein